VPDDFRLNSPDMDEVATGLAAFVCRVGAEQALDAVRVGWRWTGRIWVPSYSRTQDVTRLLVTDSSERRR
jgi:hypothetical protein